MLRWQGAALCVALCSGCLEPLVDDDPGYSRYVLPPGSAVSSAYDDLQLNRKIDLNDGLTPPLIAIKAGWADGQEIKFWDLGAGKRSPAPAYGLARCGADGKPLPGASLREWPLVFETIPGDGDYSPFRVLSWACVTAAYNNQIISSSDAINDAIDLGLISEPQPSDTWLTLPIVARIPEQAGGVELAWAPENRRPDIAYYKGKTVFYHSFDDQEGRFFYDGKTTAVGNVYEIVKAGSTSPVRVIFSQPYAIDGAKNPAYSSHWALYTVTVKDLPDDAMGQADAEIQTWTRESDLVTINPKSGAPASKLKRADVVASMASPRVIRPFVVRPEGP